MRSPGTGVGVGSGVGVGMGVAVDVGVWLGESVALGASMGDLPVSVQARAPTNAVIINAQSLIFMLETITETGTRVNAIGQDHAFLKVQKIGQKP